MGAVVAASGLAAFAGCGGTDPQSQFHSGGGSGDGATSDASIDVLVLGGPDGSSQHDDFPNPILDNPDGGAMTVPSNAPSLFGPPSQGAQSGGPCLFEPEVGVLYPRNWLRPRFQWTAPAGENLFEIRIHVANQQSDLLVYTAQPSWTMPANVWDDLRLHSNDVAMTVSIRGAALSGGTLSAEALGSSGPIGVAPADAPGAIVYWTTSNGTSLKGFRIGDETVGVTLLTSQVKEVSLGAGDCLGCHVGSPDGDYALFSTDLDTWGNAVALINPDAGALGATPSFLGAGAQQTLATGPLGINAVSQAHWSPGDHVMISSDGTNLVWVDLEAANAASARGTIALTGTQTGGTLAGAPAWSHDGNTIVYVATDHLNSGRLGGDYQQQADPGGTADLFTVPYNKRQGGAIAPIAGANDPAKEEYYPSFSPDDAYIAFDECPNDLNMYNQHMAEVYVIAKGGGTATRLQANDPPMCKGVASPGVTNSWPKWAPAVTTTPDGRAFYWLVFSSTRLGTLPQLFVTPIVVKGGKVQTYSALYLWNQPATEGNHTPAWEYFNVPPPPPPK